MLQYTKWNIKRLFKQDLENGEFGSHKLSKSYYITPWRRTRLEDTKKEPRLHRIDTSVCTEWDFTLFLFFQKFFFSRCFVFHFLYHIKIFFASFFSRLFCTSLGFYFLKNFQMSFAASALKDLTSVLPKLCCQLSALFGHYLFGYLGCWTNKEIFSDKKTTRPSS